MLQRLKIRGYKSIKEMELELRNINILIGANGSGKSNLLDVFEFLGSIYRCELKAYSTIRGADGLLFYGSKNTDEMELEFTLSSNDGFENGYKITLVPKINIASNDSSGALFIKNECASINKLSLKQEPRLYEICQYEQESRLKERVSVEDLKFNAKKPSTPVFKYVSNYIYGLRKYHFHDMSPQARVKQACFANDNLFFKFDGANLPAFLRMLHKKHLKEYMQIRDTVRLVYPHFDDFYFREMAQTDKNIKLEWFDKNQPEIPFTAHALSDGTLRFICLAVIFLQPLKFMPSTIIIDEPELGLHPEALRKLAGMIQVASKKTQVIISTHSVELLNYFKPENIVVAERDKDGVSKFKNVENSEVLQVFLESYDGKLGEVWNTNLLGGRP